MNPLKEAVLKAARAEAIPAGENGLWHIKKFDLAKPLFTKKPDCNPFDVKGETIPAGCYTSLFRYTDATMMTGGELVMHDVPHELRTHLEFMLTARGRVLITGLGLGCVARGCLANPAVSHVVVIEKCASVMKLVAPYMPTRRLTIIHADALEWVKKPRRFDCAWHDLWTDTGAGEPALAVVHNRLLLDLTGRVKLQGAWAFPRRYRRLNRELFNYI